MKISQILDQIDNGSIALPEFQRGYVWNRDQVRRLMDSLYRRHPVGSLLVWNTRTEHANARGGGELQVGTVKLLLDGQQRITTLYGIIRGRPPQFFDGNERNFTGLYFHIDDEIFQFYAPLRMADDPRWISVTELMQKGLGAIFPGIMASPKLGPRADVYFNRLNAIYGIRDIDLHIEEVTGEDKTVDVVVDIFNRVNSGGTKLSKGDLALAKICASWPQAREEMQQRLRKYERAGFNFKLDCLLRNINTIVTGEALFSFLEGVEPAEFRQGLIDAERYIDRVLDLVASRLGLDHDRVLGSRYSFPLMVRYLAQRNGVFESHHESDRLLYWYIHTLLWGRYAGSTETVLNQDLRLIEEGDGALDRLIQHLRRDRGDLRIHADDFSGWNRGARFYPLLYMLTRVWKARDWGTGLELSSHLLGRRSGLQLHHIFPKARLYKHGYERPQVNALANFTFLTQETNLRVSDRDPAEYLEEFAARNPGVIESHWIPMDRDLWKIENYADFLAARRELLAAAANSFLDSLLHGLSPAEPIPEGESILDREVGAVPGGVEDDEELRTLVRINDWVVEHGLPDGELEYELVDETTGELLAILDLAWPDGLQQGLSHPVVLLLGGVPEIEEAANSAGYRFFTDVEAFERYVQEEVLAEEMVPA